MEVWGKIFERAIDWLLSNSFELQFAKSGESTPEASCRLQQGILSNWQLDNEKEVIIRNKSVYYTLRYPSDSNE